MSQPPEMFCFFPTFNESSMAEGVDLELFQTIHLPIPEDFWPFCQKHGISSCQLLAASWAVILRTYTGGNQVLFGVEYGASDEQVIRCCMDVESNHAPLALVGETLYENQQLMPGDARFGTFNSAIVTNCQPSKLLSPEVCYLTSHGSQVKGC